MPDEEDASGAINLGDIDDVVGEGSSEGEMGEDEGMKDAEEEMKDLDKVVTEGEGKKEEMDVDKSKEGASESCSAKEINGQAPDEVMEEKT